MGADLTKAEMLKYEVEELEKKELNINLQLRELQIKLNELVPKKDKIKVKDEIKPIYDPTLIDREELDYEPENMLHVFKINTDNLSDAINIDNSKKEDMKSDTVSKKSASIISSHSSSSSSENDSSNINESKSVKSSLNKSSIKVKESIINYKDDIVSQNGIPIKAPGLN